MSFLDERADKKKAAKLVKPVGGNLNEIPEVEAEGPASASSDDRDAVDVPAHEDSAEYQLGSQNTYINIDKLDIDKLDIDLTDISVDREVFAESGAHSINPLKPFSHQVSLDLDDLHKQGYITPRLSDTPLTNSFRMIKRPLLNIARGKGNASPGNPNVIMISSSLSGEGKSFIAINLAISIAMERDKHVLLIDADVVKPTHQKVFGLGDRDGLTDLLLGRVRDMSDVIFKTNIPSFSVMVAGRIVDHVTELLASQAMEDFIEEIAGRYPDRIIIVDSPPLLMTTEASVLAPLMGQVVLVVEAEKTLRHQVEMSLGLLSNEVTFLVLNKMRGADDGGGYGYYGYGQKN